MSQLLGAEVEAAAAAAASSAAAIRVRERAFAVASSRTRLREYVVVPNVPRSQRLADAGVFATTAAGLFQRDLTSDFLTVLWS